MSIASRDRTNDASLKRNAVYSFMLYFRLNRSILPAVSTSFCFPVKNGWQEEQISTLMLLTVERVSMAFPQAQEIAVISYLG